MIARSTLYPNLLVTNPRVQFLGGVAEVDAEIAAQLRSLAWMGVIIDNDDVETDSDETDDVETDSDETDDVETDDVETDDVETDDVETDDVETDSDETDDVETDGDDDTAEPKRRRKARHAD
ncbi:hypothetical protein [Actinobaculum sp. 352]|uniref:hypothetical protein n=1 Tax=Actinobaculum sp. 352 TaxID=2490946 RepID=UPI0013DF2BD7|nr:hypothetical protein [Actinobaculum sp. 352]